nr:HAD-IA family hydrolase [uncultured Novosphingobium sp.]
MRCLFGKLIADPQRLDWFLATVVTEEWHFQHDAGRDLAEMVTERKALFPQEAALIDAYATRFLETIPGPVIGSTELLNRLGERDVPLYAITNFASVFWAEFLPTQPHFEHFRDIVVSGDEKIAKPDRRIFDLAARRFGFAPPEMLFIDDNAANIAAARALNWQVHHFNDVATLEQDLLQRGLL